VTDQHAANDVPPSKYVEDVPATGFCIVDSSSF
jgi:hypothetical protein